jgi:hypothetical protein
MQNACGLKKGSIPNITLVVCITINRRFGRSWERKRELSLLRGKVSDNDALTLSVPVVGLIRTY